MELPQRTSCGHAETLERPSSADPTVCDALVHAADNGNLSVVASLMLSRADPTQASHAGLSPLDRVHDVKALALMCALAPPTSHCATDVLELDSALGDLPEELRRR